MNRIHPSQPSHRNFRSKNSASVDALIRVYQAYSTHNDFVEVWTTCRRRRTVGIRKYRGSISELGTRTSAVLARKPSVQSRVAEYPEDSSGPAAIGGQRAHVVAMPRPKSRGGKKGLRDIWRGEKAGRVGGGCKRRSAGYRLGGRGGKSCLTLNLPLIAVIAHVNFWTAKLIIASVTVEAATRLSCHQPPRNLFRTNTAKNPSQSPQRACRSSTSPQRVS